MLRCVKYPDSRSKGCRERAALSPCVTSRDRFLFIRGMMTVSSFKYFLMAVNHKAMLIRWSRSTALSNKKHFAPQHKKRRITTSIRVMLRCVTCSTQVFFSTSFFASNNHRLHQHTQSQIVIIISSPIFAVHLDTFHEFLSNKGKKHLHAIFNLIHHWILR